MTRLGLITLALTLAISNISSALAQITWWRLPSGEQLGYTPADGDAWPDPDPTTLGGALNKLAALIDGAVVPAASGASDGDVLTADGLGAFSWEPVPAAGGLSYTPGDADDWDPDPTTVAGALDDLGSRGAVPSASAAGDGDVLTADGAGAYAWEAAPAGSSPATVTFTTGAIAGGGAGEETGNTSVSSSHIVVLQVAMRRTAGAADTAQLILYSDDAHSADAQPIIGSAFSGVAVGADWVYGPMFESGSTVPLVVPYVDGDGTGELHWKVTNKDFDGADAGTYQVALAYMPSGLNLPE